MSATLRARFLSKAGKLCSSFCKKLSHMPKNEVPASCATIGRAYSAKTTQNIEEKKINVNGVDINYVRTGTGQYPVLLLPGALGTIWTDFKPQIEGLSKEKFTIVAWDPPGYGRSRPPDRTFPVDFFKHDAVWAHNLMKKLDYKTYSLIGWSDGGITSFLIASLYPESVHKMIVIGANAYVLPQEFEVYESIRNIDTWSERMKKPLLEIYGEDYFRKTWSDWVDAMPKVFSQENANLYKNAVASIKCPSLIVHGAKDAMVNIEHPTYLKEHIKNSRLKIFEKGAHNLHLRYPEEFNALATEFLLEQSNL